ncbi:cohesin domain-containing protein [Accumulibacter sp.]|uniref:cohesin domain-containing protein n=1 Tax=Accumulibacter sp. TaxID=2053492 RepID=UPI0025F7D4E9|nr:cohesin domain-containing protein [Accumulibacter sp.]MCM8612759.1 cohesin domain-containing protein [Accumulibacter sp.]MCM8637591.1 cohesin domain-containing protein [Accumulibacter sp.]MCM8639692.1 cohesin domain-containing protein [Accumulibacter sp.]
MNPRTILAPLAAAVAVGLSPPAAAGYALSLHATPSSGTVGGQVVVDVNLTLDGRDTLLGMDFVLNYAPDVLQYLGSADGSLTPRWGAWALPFGSPAGWIRATFLDPTFSGLDSTAGPLAGSIASLTFALHAPGISTLTLSDIVLADTQGDQQSPSGTPGSARVEVLPGSSIPSPGSLPLVGLALALLCVPRRGGGAARRAG